MIMAIDYVLIASVPSSSSFSPLAFFFLSLSFMTLDLSRASPSATVKHYLFIIIHDAIPTSRSRISNTAQCNASSSSGRASQSGHQRLPSLNRCLRHDLCSPSRPTVPTHQEHHVYRRCVFHDLRNFTPRYPSTRPLYHFVKRERSETHHADAGTPYHHVSDTRTKRNPELHGVQLP
jgi:hypothetical protein